METYKYDLTQESPVRHKPRILVVEDDLSIEPIWEYILKKADANAVYDWSTHVTEAGNLIETALATGRGYDLVVSDIYLAGEKTGLDLWARYHHALQGRIILVSGIDYNKMAHELHGHEDEAPFYLKKPLVPHECIEAVYGMLHTPRT